MATAAAVATTIPQISNHPSLANSANNNNDKWNNMESALDFDLLAEYLLEDVGAGGFDFSVSPDTVSPPTIEIGAQKFSHGVVTPHQSDLSFADPLYDGTAQFHQPYQSPPVYTGGAVAAVPLPVSGDLAGELSQVQQRIAIQQQQIINTAQAVAPPQHQQHALAQQQPQPQTHLPRPLAPNMMAVRHPPHQQPKAMTAPAAAAPVAVSITQRAQIAPLQKNVPPVMPMAQQPIHKRPRVSVGAPPSFAKKSTIPSYSFASAVASVNKGAPAMRTATGAPLPPAHQAAGGLPNTTSPGGAANQHNSTNKSQAQIDRRRERNRILARRTRLRKKFFFESLQKDVSDLQRENAALKSIVRSRLKPDDSRVILETCNANERLPSAIHAKEIEGASNNAAAAASGLGGEAGGGVKTLDKEDFSLIQSIQNSQQCFIITDPSLHDNPIVYASDDFLTLTGYSQEEVLGRNCRFLQGTETCQEKVAQIRKGSQAGEDVNVTFVNYTSDGKPFWNSLFIAALRDADNNIVNFIGVIVKVAGPEVGDSEYGKILK